MKLACRKGVNKFITSHKISHLCISIIIDVPAIAYTVVIVEVVHLFNKRFCYYSCLIVSACYC